MTKFQSFRLTTTQLLMALAAMFFFQDVVVDIREHFEASQVYMLGELIHLVFEITAVAALTFGLIDSVKYTRSLKERAERQSQSLYHLKQDFDSLVTAKFSTWGLTPAERDVALLLLRGLPSDKIADLRKVTLGTIKVQAHSVLQKAGVSSRVELMSLFMDEFIDVGIETDLNHQSAASLNDVTE